MRGKRVAISGYGVRVSGCGLRVTCFELRSFRCSAAGGSGFRCQHQELRDLGIKEFENSEIKGLRNSGIQGLKT